MGSSAETTLPESFVYSPALGADATGEARLESVLAGTVQLLKNQSFASREWAFDHAPGVLAKAAKIFTDPTTRQANSIMRAFANMGLNPPMAREAIVNFFSRLDEGALRRWRDRELSTAGDALLLPPCLILHVFAGNLWLSGIESLLAASLLGTANLVRCSSADTHVPRLWLDIISQVEPQFARLLAISYWPAVHDKFTEIAAEGADCVVAFGDDTSVAAVRSHIPFSKRFIAHGSKLSFAVLTGADLSPAIAEALAYDFSVYDQQGCLSPRAAFIVEADPERARAFGNKMADEMRHLARRLPAGRLSLPDAADLARTRDQAAIAQVTGNEILLASTRDDPFVVTVSPAEKFSPGCVHRNVDLRIVDSWDTLADLLQPYRFLISTIGAADSVPELLDIAEDLRVSRVCRVGQMQRPPLGWTHDGRIGLLDLVDLQSNELE